MVYDATQHHRRSIRLREYDYSLPGAYFVTICTHRWESLFGIVVDGEMVLNDLGRIVDTEWMRTAEIRSYVKLDEYVVMPNHVHGIVMITEHGRGIARYAPTVPRFSRMVPGSLSTVIRAFKSAVTKHINHLQGTPGRPVWQRNYFEHVIRNDQDLNRIRTYIHHNAHRWHLDHYNPEATEQDEFDSWLDSSGGSD